jgi:hypothetical protein
MGSHRLAALLLKIGLAQTNNSLSRSNWLRYSITLLEIDVQKEAAWQRRLKARSVGY